MAESLPAKRRAVHPSNSVRRLTSTFRKPPSSPKNAERLGPPSL
jgi:hypothetical protein